MTRSIRGSAPIIVKTTAVIRALMKERVNRDGHFIISTAVVGLIRGSSNEKGIRLRWRSMRTLDLLNSDGKRAKIKGVIIGETGARAQLTIKRG